MLTALIILLISRIRKNRLIKKNLVLLFLISVPAILIAQGVRYKYDILKNGKSAGQVIVLHTREGNRDLIHLEAFIKTNLVIGIRVKNIEKIITENGLIIHSSFHRTINNNNPVSRTISFREDHYTVEDNGTTRKLNVDQIKLNMASIYVVEPAEATRIYSDASEKFLQVRQLSQGVYQVSLPDGGKNIYHYENKICKKIEVRQKLFHAEIHLRSISKL
ncbi:MAG: DUF6134 family protein [Flavitalea sp.]